MMWSECARNDDPVICSGVTLQCIWQVDAEPPYQTWPQRTPDAGLIAIRTFSGLGAAEVAGFGRFELSADTLFFTKWKHLHYYGAAGAQWRFAWFEFHSEGGIGLPWHELLRITPTPWETATTVEAFSLLPMPDLASRAAASAFFNAMLFDWAARWQRSHERPDPQREMVYRAIRRMQQDLAHPVEMDILAGDSGIGTRRFRQIFRQVMGESPKQYYTNLRLRQAAFALRMGMGSVTQLAEQLGYSSPYHFSSAFKAKFGVSPSLYQRKAH
ncbi:MAG: helix-turn-helix transcriptional regulator [Armatimonadota bacterium]